MCFECVCVTHFPSVSGWVALVLQVATAKGKTHIHTNTLSRIFSKKHEKVFLSSCRGFEGQCVCVATGVKHLSRRVRVAAVCHGVKLQLCVELPLVHAQTTCCSDPEPQAPGLWWQLLHHRSNEGGCGKLPVPSGEVGQQHHHSAPQPADHNQCFR